MNKWLHRADEVKKKHGLGSDRELAHLLGVSQQAMSKFRKGGNMSVETKLKLLDLEKEWMLREALKEAYSDVKSVDD